VTYSGIIVAMAVVLVHMRSLLFDLVRRLKGELGQRHEAESGRRQSLDKFAAVFETSPDAISVTRMSDGLLIEANDEMFRQARVTRESAIGRTVAEIGLGLDP